MRTVVYLALLLGIGPFLITYTAVGIAIENGARNWPDWVFAGGFTVLHLALMAFGGWLFTFTKD